MEGELKMDIRSIRHNCRLLYHLTQIPIRCLSPDSSICFTFPHLEGMERFPLPLLPESLPHKNTVPLPVLFMENNAYYSAALPLALIDRNFTLYFGPCLFSRLSDREFKQSFPDFSALPPDMRFPLMSALPVMEQEYFYNFLSLACSLFFREKVHTEEILEANHLKMSAPIPAAVQKTLFHRRESAAFHTPYSYEKNLLDAVRSGDVVRAKECMNELSLTGKPGILSPNPLRHAQNLFIAHITQITRAAMEAGVEEDMAYAMSDSYIQASEKCTSVTRLLSLRDQATGEFTAAAAKARGLTSHSPAIRRAINYMNDHQQEKVYLSDIACAAGLSKDRFSHLFREEMGMSPMEYLNRKRVETSKSLLTVFQYSISEISMILSFSSQSHYISVFKKYTGMTPRQYRDAF